jgi:hypothetical protein
VRIVPLILPTRRSLGVCLLIGAAVGGAIAAAAAGTAHQGPPGWMLASVVVLGALGGVALPTATALLATHGLAPLLALFAAAIGHVATPGDDYLPGLAIGCAVLIGIELVTKRALPTAVIAVAAALALWGNVDATAGSTSGSITALVAFWPVLAITFVHLARPRAWHQPMWRWHVVVGVAVVGAVIVTARVDTRLVTVGTTLFDACVMAPMSLAAALWWIDRGDARRGRRRHPTARTANGTIRSTAAGTS